MWNYVLLLPARTGQIPNLLLKEDAFRNSESFNCLEINLIQFVFVPVPSLFILLVFIVYKAWACWPLDCCYSFYSFLFLGRMCFPEKRIVCTGGFSQKYVFPKVCSWFRQWSPWLCRQISFSRPSCTESHLITEILYGCGIQGNRLHS